MALNYLNFYLVAIFGCFFASVAGIMICYSGLSETSYLSYLGPEITTFYLDKKQYDLYLYGLVYSLTFGIALLLFLGVILIPSPEQIKKRQTKNQFETNSVTDSQRQDDLLIQSDEVLPEKELQLNEDKDNGREIVLEPDGIELEPDLENLAIEEVESEISETSDDDSDVVYGTGRITDSSEKSFIISNPDSAVKFLLRKELDGRPLKSSQEEIYEEWQRRGLSRGRLRKHFLKIMNWDSVPELEVIEIYNNLKDRVYEIKNSENK